MIKSKRQMYIVIGAFLLTILLGTVTYAFFNYTRTGSNNTIKTGRIAFNTNQTDTINLTNVFPIDRSTIGTDTTNTDEVVISITGDTTYTEGLEYLVTAVDVNNTIGSGNNQKNIPISISVTASNLGEEDEEYFDNRENANSHMYRVLAGDVIEEDGRILVGYIKSGATGINGTLTIKSYLDKDKIAITDTYDGEESDNMGTTTDWVDNRTILTTQEWNSLQQNGVSFKVKVESNEGIWVEEIRTINAMGHLFEILSESGTYNRRNDIKKIVFQKMGATRMQNAYDAATVKLDVTANNEGKVLAWLEENEDDSTMYTLVVASDGDTYFTYNGSLFNNVSSVEEIEFNNINTSRLTSMDSMFYNCSKLKSIDLSSFNMENITTTNGMFWECTDLESVNLTGINTNNVVNMSAMFKDCTSLTVIDISNLGGDNLEQASAFFEGCTNLETINMSGFNFGKTNSRIVSFFGTINNLKHINMSNVDFGTVTDLTAMLYEKTSLIDIDFSGVDTSNITNMTAMFYGCSNLQKIYVSDSWNVENVTDSSYMLSGCTSLVGQAPNTSYSYDSDDAIDKTYARIATDDTKGYLTDISLKPTN